MVTDKKQMRKEKKITAENIQNSENVDPCSFTHQ
jgi:hypothetical protein